MKNHWCWRCNAIVPMLDIDEVEVLSRAHEVKSYSNPSAALAVLDAEAEKRGLPIPIRPRIDTPAMAKALWHVIACYHMFTGVLLDSPNSVWHHLITAHGPPCRHCGKLLRTPKASSCVVCGNRV